MSDTERSIAAEVQRKQHDRQATLLHKTEAYWYACGYNDHRAEGQPYADAVEFVEFWLAEQAKPSHHSLQDTFKAWMKPAPAVKHHPVIIQCATCTRQTTDIDKWDPEARTGIVYCDTCWPKRPLS